MSRIELLAPGDAWAADFDSLSPGDGFELVRAQALAHLPGFAAALAGMKGAVATSGKIEPVVRETAAIATVRRNPFEMSQAKSRARALGVSDDAIEAIVDEDWTE